MGTTFDDVLTRSRRGKFDDAAWFDQIIYAIGYDKVKECLPFPVKILSAAYTLSQDFLALPYDKWLEAAGYKCEGLEVFPLQKKSRLQKLIEGIGVDDYTCEECIDILKRVATREVHFFADQELYEYLGRHIICGE